MNLPSTVNQKAINLGIFVALYVIVLLFLITKGFFLIAVLFSLFPFAAMLSTKRNNLYFLTILSSVALLGVPGIRFESVSLGFLLQLVVLVFFVQDLLIRHKKLPRLDASDVFLLIFLANVVVTASIRGFGFLRFGGNMVGGMFYVQVITAFLFYLYLKTLNIKPHVLERLFVFMVIASAIPFFVQAAVTNIPSLYPMADFFVFSKFRVFQSAELLADGRTGRYESVVNFSYLLICMGTILKSEKKNWGLILAIIGVILLLMSGFRRYAVLSLFVFVACMIFLSKNRILGVIGWGGLGALAALCIYLFASLLPFNVQRAIAFIPGVQVDVEATKSTEGSFEWRMEIYRLCWDDLPNHLLIGKGFLDSLEDKIDQLSYASLFGTGPYYAYLTRNYHSGILELILTQGLLGFLSFLFLCITMLRKIGRHINKHRDDSRVWRILAVLYCVCIAMLIDYFSVRGEFRNFLAPFLLFFGTLMLMYRAHYGMINSNNKTNSSI